MYSLPATTTNDGYRAASFAVKSNKTERNQEIADMFLDGYTVNDIGRYFGISKQRVSFILHGLGIRAEEDFTTVVLPEPYVIAVDFGDAHSRMMMEWSEAKILPKFDEVMSSSPERLHDDLRKFSKLEHVIAYVPSAMGAATYGREIKSSWLTYAYPLIESQVTASSSI